MSDCETDQLLTYLHEQFPAVGHLAIKEKLISLQQRIAQLKAEKKELLESEHQTSDAYLRIRSLVGAWNTNHGGENRYEVTEQCIKDIISERDSLKSQLAGLKKDVLDELKITITHMTPLQSDLINGLKTLCEKCSGQNDVCEHCGHNELYHGKSCIICCQLFDLQKVNAELKQLLAAAEAKGEALKALAQTLMDDTTWPNEAKESAKHIFLTSPSTFLREYLEPVREMVEKTLCQCAMNTTLSFENAFPIKKPTGGCARCQALQLLSTLTPRNEEMK